MFTRNQLLEFGPIGESFPVDGDRRRYNPVSAAIGVGGTLLGGLIGSSGAKKAGQTLANAGTQSQKTLNDVTQTQSGFVSAAGATGQQTIDTGKNQANATLYGVNQAEQGNLNPYLTAGTAGINAFSNAIAPGGSLTTQFTAPTAAQAMATPGLQFQMQQGNEAIERSAAAGGSLGSGGTAKALDQYSQGLASTYYQNAYNNALQSFQTNRNNQFQDLSTMAGIGLTSTGMSNQAFQNYGNLTSANTMNASNAEANMGLGTAQFNANLNQSGTEAGLGYYMQGQQGLAAGQMGASNAWQGALGGVANVAGQQYAISQGISPYGGGYGASYGGGYGGPVPPGATMATPSGGYGGGAPSTYDGPTSVPSGNPVTSSTPWSMPLNTTPWGMPLTQTGPTPGAPQSGGSGFFVPQMYNPNMSYNPNMVYSNTGGY
jgi:hypothetical protein